MSTTVVIVLIVVLAVVALRVLRPKRSSASINLPGPGTYEFDIVGEASYQDALSDICGGKKESSADLYVDAELYLEDENPHDSKAVCVSVEGKTVGYLSRKDARNFRKQVKEFEDQDPIFFCKAVIVGGWKKSKRDQGNFGVRLDLPVN